MVGVPSFVVGVAQGVTSRLQRKLQARGQCRQSSEADQSAEPRLPTPRMSKYWMHWPLCEGDKPI